MGGDIIDRRAASCISSPRRDFNSSLGLSTPWHPWNDTAVRHIACQIQLNPFCQWVMGFQYDWRNREKVEEGREEWWESASTSFFYLLLVFSEGERLKLRGCVDNPFLNPSLDIVLPSLEFYHNNRSCLISGGSVTENNKSHLFYSGILKTKDDKRRKKGGGGKEGDGALRGWEIMGRGWEWSRKRRTKLWFCRACVFILLFVRLSAAAQSSKWLRNQCFVSL